jgi:hypothetical protein
MACPYGYTELWKSGRSKGAPGIFRKSAEMIENKAVTHSFPAKERRKSKEVVEKRRDREWTVLQKSGGKEG